MWKGLECEGLPSSALRALTTPVLLALCPLSLSTLSDTTHTGLAAEEAVLRPEEFGVRLPASWAAWAAWAGLGWAGSGMKGGGDEGSLIETGRV